MYKEFNIFNSINTITSDKASNNIKGLEILNKFYNNKLNFFYCFAHTLNNIVTNFNCHILTKYLNKLYLTI